MLAYMDKLENGKILVAYGFHSWQVIDFWVLQRKNYLGKLRLRLDISLIYSWFSFDPNSNYD